MARKPRSGATSLGNGWGGPPKGPGNGSPRAPAFQKGNKVASGYHDMSDMERVTKLKAIIFDVATGEETSDQMKVIAADKLLDRIEGKPLQRQVNINAEGGVAEVLNIEFVLPGNGDTIP